MLPFYIYCTKTKRALFNRTYWNDNPKLPVYDRPKSRIDTEKAASIILDEAEEDMLCGVQPTCVDKNALIIVDLEKIKDPKDVTCDDMGSWRLNGTHPVYFTKNAKGEISTVSLTKAKKGKLEGKVFKMVKRYYYHKTATDYLLASR